MSENSIAVTAVIAMGAVVCSMFAFLAVASWAHARRRERESYYRNETLKKVAEAHAGGTSAALDLYREQARIAARNRREAEKLSGLITLGVGIGLMAFLRAIVPHRPVYLVGLIPVLIGVAVLSYAYVLAPKREE